MLKAYKYRIYPNKTQEELLAKTFGCCRFVYNRTLAYRKEKYEKEKKSIREFVTNDDGMYPAKSPIGMFDLYIPNDLGLVVDKIAEYYE